MQLNVLVENRVSKRGLKAEHGLSFLLESDGHTLLFDMGATEQYMLNAKHLGYDLSKVDVAVISHGHNDHTGGLAQFVEENNFAKIYAKKETFEPKYKNERYIGVDTKININQERFVPIDEVAELLPNVFVFPVINKIYSSDQHKDQFFTRKGDNVVPDNFDDELFIVIIHDNKISVLSSCSHCGISNIVETARRYFDLPVHTVIGGFHLKDDALGTKFIIDYFNSINPERIFTGHCTGINAFVELKNNCNAEVGYFETGMEFYF